MTELPPLLTAGNAQSAVAACFSDAGYPDAKFTIAEGDGTVTIIASVLAADEVARQQIQARLQAIAHAAVEVSVEARTFYPGSGEGSPTVADLLKAHAGVLGKGPGSLVRALGQGAK